MSNHDDLSDPLSQLSEWSTSPQSTRQFKEKSTVKHETVKLSQLSFEPEASPKPASRTGTSAKTGQRHGQTYNPSPSPSAKENRMLMTTPTPTPQLSVVPIQLKNPLGNDVVICVHPQPIPKKSSGTQHQLGKFKETTLEYSNNLQKSKNPVDTLLSRYNCNRDLPDDLCREHTERLTVLEAKLVSDSKQVTASGGGAREPSGNTRSPSPTAPASRVPSRPPSIPGSVPPRPNGMNLPIGSGFGADTANNNSSSSPDANLGSYLTHPVYSFAGSVPLRTSPTQPGVLYEKHSWKDTKRHGTVGTSEVAGRFLRPDKPTVPIVKTPKRVMAERMGHRQSQMQCSKTLPNGIPISQIDRFSARREAHRPPTPPSPTAIFEGKPRSPMGGAPARHASSSTLAEIGTIERIPPRAGNAAGAGPADEAAGRSDLGELAELIPAGAAAKLAASDPLSDEAFYNMVRLHFRGMAQMQTTALRAEIRNCLPTILKEMHCAVVSAPRGSAGDEKDRASTMLAGPGTRTKQPPSSLDAAGREREERNDRLEAPGGGAEVAWLD